MSLRRNSPEPKREDEIALDVLGEDGNLPESAADDENSYQNHMLIYDEDIDNMLDELDDDWGTDDDDDPAYTASSPLLPTIKYVPRPDGRYMYQSEGESRMYRSEPERVAVVSTGTRRRRLSSSSSDSLSDASERGGRPTGKRVGSSDDGNEIKLGAPRMNLPKRRAVPPSMTLQTDDFPSPPVSPGSADRDQAPQSTGAGTPKERTPPTPRLGGIDQSTIRFDSPPPEPLPPTPPTGPIDLPLTPPMPGNVPTRPSLPGRTAVVADDDVIGSPSSPPFVQPMGKLMGTRAPMSKPAPVRRRATSDFLKKSKLDRITTLLQKGKKGAEEVFDILIRSVKLSKDDATMRILKALEKNDENLCDEKYREKESTASLLHIALLYQRTELCKKLITKYPDLLKVKYTSKDYRNQTCFHIAAANDQRGGMIYFMLMKLPEVEKQIILNTIADGSYFIEERPEAATCLSAAVWMGQVHMIRTLVEAGADLGLRGIDGNTLLHHIVVLSTTGLSLSRAQCCIREVYDSCHTWWSHRRKDATRKSEGVNEQLRFDAFCHLISIQNDSGLNPIALAVSMHSPLTPFILNFEPIYKRPQVKFGAVAWATYDVTDIVSHKEHPSKGHVKGYDCSSVLHVLAHTKRILSESVDRSKVQTDIAELEPINTAIKMKWSVFRWVYIFWCFVHLAYMIALSAVALIPFKNDPKSGLTLSYVNFTTPGKNSSFEDGVSSVQHKRLAGLFLIIPVFYIFFEVIDLVVGWRGFGTVERSKIASNELRCRRLKSYILNHCTVTGNAPYRLLAVSFSVCMFTWYGLFREGNTNCDIPLSLALILGWIFMMNFTRGCRHVCRFSIMIQKMFFRDFLYFITVYMFVLIAFSSALHLVLPPGRSVGTTVMGLLNIVTNAGVEADDAKPIQQHYAAAVLSMYAIVSVILLLNMLIAMMNTSYEAVKSSKTNLWRYQQLSILLMLERRLNWWKWICLRSQSDTKGLVLPTFDKGHHFRIFLDVTEEKVTD